MRQQETGTPRAEQVTGRCRYKVRGTTGTIIIGYPEVSRDSVTTLVVHRLVSADHRTLYGGTRRLSA